MTIRDFVISGRKTVCVAGQHYYAEMVSVRRLWNLIIGYNLNVGDTSVSARDPNLGMEILARAIAHRTARIFPPNPFSQ